ncbi:hypothetical protein KP509_17G015600 [Ceratopteris richardii]|uniref:Uncharacterized protein n=1 Tax=Ceratopteris richardii TaxID=49495 RepID=A0A8T2SVU6_CERRI|nr:hypothetical protein KP509_17G015600 [Ceratopteris richardii]
MLDTEAENDNLEEELEKIMMLADNICDSALSGGENLAGNASSKKQKGARRSKRSSTVDFALRTNHKNLRSCTDKSIHLQSQPRLSPLAARAALAASVTPIREGAKSNLCDATPRREASKSNVSDTTTFVKSSKSVVSDVTTLTETIKSNVSDVTTPKQDEKANVIDVKPARGARKSKSPEKSHVQSVRKVNTGATIVPEDVGRKSGRVTRASARQEQASSAGSSHPRQSDRNVQLVVDITVDRRRKRTAK